MDLLQAGLRELLSLPITLPSPRQLLHLPLFASLAPTPAEQLQQLSLDTSPSCGSPILSCPKEDPSPLKSCCFNYPSGHFLLTQFWDTSPAIGISDSWTIHGLWPDLCTGGFDAFCDKTQNKSPEEITAILSSAAQSGTHPDLLAYMIRYWLSNDHRNSNLWSHEWNKHGTCVSTLEPKCYGDASTTVEASSQDKATEAAILDYFTHATRLFSRLNTYSFLAEHDILPSTSKTYTLSELEAAIESSATHGFPVTLRCNQRHELDEIWYHFLVRGSLRGANATSTPGQEDDTFVPTAPDGQISNCPKTGIRYLPKGSPPHLRPTHTVTSTATATATATPIPTSHPFTGRGHLKIRILPTDPSSPATDESPTAGCLIRPGTWYRSGTCAVFTAQTDVGLPSPLHDDPMLNQHQDDPGTAHLFTLHSSLGPCSVILPRHAPSTLSSHPQFSRSKSESQQRPLHANAFTCSPTLHSQLVFASSFTHPGVLVYRNSTVFFAEKVPGRFEQVEIFADSKGMEKEVRVEVVWESVA